MKKYLALMLVIAVTLGMAACGAAKPAEEPETREFNIIMSIESIPDEAQEKAVIAAGYDDGEILWTYETEPVYVGMYEGIADIGQNLSGYTFVCDGTVYCLSPIDGSVWWSNDEYQGQGTSWCFDEENNLYLSAAYGPVLMVIDKDGNTVSRYEDLYYNFDGELSPSGDYYMPHSIGIKEAGKVDIALESSGTVVTVDPATGVILDEYIYTEPVTPGYLAGSWFIDGENNLRIDIEEDMSYQIYICDNDGATKYIYAGTLELGTFDEAHSTGTDYLKFMLDYDKTKAIAGGEFADLTFEGLASAGDYIVNWMAEYEDYDDVMMLTQVNNGDSVCDYYLGKNYLYLVKKDIKG